MKQITLKYRQNGKVYYENNNLSFDNENLATGIQIEVPSEYKDYTFVMDCKNGSATNQYELGTGETSYTFYLDNSLTLTGTLELQLWATILDSEENTVKVQWEKYLIAIDQALNISEITAEANPDIIATHTAQIVELYTRLGIDFVETGETINSAGLVTKTNNKIYDAFEYSQAAVYYSASTIMLTEVIDIDTDKALVFYTANGTGLRVKLATVDGNNITYSSDVQVVSTALAFSKPVKIATNKVVIGFTNASRYPQVCVVSVSGSTISIGTIYPLNGTAVVSRSIKLAYLSTNTVMCIYTSDTSSYLNYQNRITISGTTISVGTSTEIIELAGKSIVNFTFAGRQEYVLVNYSISDTQDTISNAKFFRVMSRTSSNLRIGDEFTISSFSQTIQPKINIIDDGIFLVTCFNRNPYIPFVAYICKWSTDVSTTGTFFKDSVSPFQIISRNSNINVSLINLDSNHYLVTQSNSAYILTIDDNNIIRVSDVKLFFSSTGINSPFSCNLSPGKALVIFVESNSGKGGVIDINNATGVALTSQFNSKQIAGRTDNINLVPYLPLT